MPVRAPRPHLREVTLCAVSSSNVAATILALEASLAEVAVAETLLFTDVDPAALGIAVPDTIRIVPIERIGSSAAYSRFILEKLVDHVATSHCLIAQWDGHVADGTRWRDEFLEYDYIGASWPQFDDGHAVGNGGFSLRSRRLMDACRHPDFIGHHPEDVAIGRTNRVMLEQLGLRFAPVDLADRFSAERAGDPATAFGYHGVFRMPTVLGSERFWSLYRRLDDRATLRHDFGDLLRRIIKGRNGVWRGLVLTAVYLKDLTLGRS
ncbi:MAG: hypothetical protein CVT75_01955 [Alphaproteobacteria bacterium HGW-Alphaproteobacteria-14]|nr:MAG: hypothetical protein CVT75_01955 [Alphaproteobacteria bacterium HGW-Alphaproteobacteria-14]